MKGMVRLEASAIEEICEFRIKEIKMERDKRDRIAIQKRIDASKKRIFGFDFGRILTEDEAEKALQEECFITWRSLIHLDEWYALREISTLCFVANNRGDGYIYLGEDYTKWVAELE